MNKFQTQLTEEIIKLYPKEVIDDLYMYINQVPYIQHLISDKRKRARDLPRKENGRIIVDLSNPHILEDMDYFRPVALHYEKKHTFTDLKVNFNPYSEYMKWFREELMRCWYGMTRPEDGE
ncbi:MAG: hypothetical protein LBE56_12420 [Tannerella sp.]|jgi:hypothetical protein|nr:hypothetical protein [Tannerella sp.]